MKLKFADFFQVCGYLLPHFTVYGGNGYEFVVSSFDEGNLVLDVAKEEDKGIVINTICDAYDLLNLKKKQRKQNIEVIADKLSEISGKPIRKKLKTITVKFKDHQFSIEKETKLKSMLEYVEEIFKK